MLLGIFEPSFAVIICYTNPRISSSVEEKIQLLKFGEEFKNT